MNAAEEISQLRQKATIEDLKAKEVEEKVEHNYQEEIYENYEQIQSNRQQNVIQVCNFFIIYFWDFYFQEEPIVKTQESDYTAEEIQEYQEDEIVDTGLTAIALYDYQAAADDEISFDPEDIITHVETVSFLCKNFGLNFNELFCRFMRVGGEVCVRENMGYFLLIMYSYNNGLIEFGLCFFHYGHNVLN